MQLTRKQMEEARSTISKKDGKKGGDTTASIPGHMKKIATKGAEARWGKKK